MNIKRVFAVSGISAIIALSGATVASAQPGPWNDCKDFSTPVKIVGGFDPAHLDNDNDGIGCEGNPGNPMAYDLYSNLRGEGDSNPPELAHTGLGPTEHPIRWYAVAGGLIVAGGVTYAVGKRKRP